MKVYQISDCKVRFNRGAAAWQCYNGRLIGEHPAGTAGKVAAIAQAFGRTQPAIFQWFEDFTKQHPVLTRRCINAAVLVHSGHVRQLSDYHAGVAEVLSQSAETLPDQTRYHTIYPLEWGWFDCNCEDYKRGRARVANHKPICKHVIAYLMAEKVGMMRAEEWQPIAGYAHWVVNSPNKHIFKV